MNPEPADYESVALPLSYGPLSKNYFLNNFFLIFVADILPILGNIVDGLVEVVKFILPPIMVVAKLIFNAIFGVLSWLYDKVFSPLMRLLGLKDPAKDIAAMNEMELRNEQRRLKREETGSFRYFSEAERARQARVNARLENIQPVGNNSGQLISDGASSQGEFDLAGGFAKLTGGNTLLADTKTNIFTGPRHFVSLCPKHATGKRARSTCRRRDNRAIL